MFTALDTIYDITRKECIEALIPEGRYAYHLRQKDSAESKICFTTPIFHGSSPVVKCFDTYPDCFSFQGSKGRIDVRREGLVLHDSEYEIRLLWNNEQHFRLSQDRCVLTSEEMSITPTFSGVRITQQYCGPLYFTCLIKSEKTGYIRMNSKSFAYMRDTFAPVMTLSTMYTDGNLKNPGVNLAMKQENESKVYLRMTASDENASHACWEINLYEPKLIMDTTVESARPNENNVYGNVAFLGHTGDHGVQYLYSRFDLSKLENDPRKKMKRFLLYIPYYKAGEQGFRMSAPFRRFCSFGSNWENKMPFTEFGAKYEKCGSYFVFDLSKYLLNEHGRFKENTGIVLYSAAPDGVSILSTADNYDRPQIVEIQYEKEKENE